MRVEVLIAALLLVADASGSAWAERAGGPREAPAFTQREQETIRRNELLTAIVDRDPWVVRRVLDVMAQEQGTLPAGIDPARNPDIAASPRTAEGSMDWIRLLKEARDRKNDQAAPSSVGRSAEASVDLLDMLSDARAAKREKAGAPSR